MTTLLQLGVYQIAKTSINYQFSNYRSDSVAALSPAGRRGVVLNLFYSGTIPLGLRK